MADNGLRCRGWRQEAILRLLENNLAIAEDPEHLVVYAAHAKVARDHESLRRIVAGLQDLRDGETLVVQSGKPIAVLPTGPRSPAVLLANGNLVGRWATPETFYDLERRGLIAWGGLTAGCWQYIGSQGVLQGTYETFAQVAREHFGGSLAGRLVVSAGLGGMGAAQPVAVSRMLGGTTLIAEVDVGKAERRLDDGTVDVVCSDLDEALGAALEGRATSAPRAVCFAGNAAELLEALVAREVVPDVVTDLTAAHDLRSGYLPVAMSLDEAAALRRGDPGKLESLALATLVRHVRAMLELRRRGAVVFDYGNNIRPHAASGGVAEALDIDIFTARYLRPLFCRGIGPFRWICLSGEDPDLDTVDSICLELFSDVERITSWIGLARTHVKRHGLPARIAWLGHGERTRLGLAVNAAVADGRLHAPVAFTRDHMDSGAMTHPNIITEHMADGSDAVSDWPLLNALLGTAAGADLVALHAGGGGYAGYSQSAGMTVVATGDDDARQRLTASLNADTAIGVLRHADAGYAEAIASARDHRLGLPGVRDLDLHAVHAAVAGGSVLAAGGGGWVDHGLLVGTTAVQYGTPRLVSLDELDPAAMLATVSAIGAPAAVGWEMRPGDYVRALQLLMEAVPEPVIGTVTAQNGSSTTCNGWVASAVLGTLVVDAAGDGRAHPTGKMGSFGLAGDDDYQTVQAVAGGNRAQNRYLEVVTRGTVRHTANVLRTAAEQSGGFISAARNPLPASFVAEHAAVGAISFALGLGEAILAAEPGGPRRMIEATVSHLGGFILAEGPVLSRMLRTENAFDIGSVQVGELELGFVNEYLTAESGGQRLATFPDVLATLSPATGRIISIANLREGDEVAVLHVPKANVPLGDGVREPSVYPEVEAMLGKPLAEYALA